MQGTHLLTYLLWLLVVLVLLKYFIKIIHLLTLEDVTAFLVIAKMTFVVNLTCTGNFLKEADGFKETD